MTSSQISELSGIDDDATGKRKRSEELEAQDPDDKTKKSRNENENKECEVTGDDDCESRTMDCASNEHSDMDTRCSSSTTTTSCLNGDASVSSTQPLPLSTQCETHENPWLLRSIVLAERVDDSRAEAVNVQEAVMFTHAFGMENMFDKCEITTTVSEPSIAEGEAGREAEKNGGGDEADPTDTEEVDRDTGDGPSDDPPEEGLRLRARIEMTMPILYAKAFSLIKGLGAQEVPLQRTKSLAAVHLGNYCSHLNRLHFDLTLRPVEVLATVNGKSRRKEVMTAPSDSVQKNSNSDHSNDISSSTPAKNDASSGSASVSDDANVVLTDSIRNSSSASDSTVKETDEGSAIVEMECDDAPSDNVQSGVEVEVESGGPTVEEAEAKVDSSSRSPSYRPVERWMLHMVKSAGSEGISLDELQQAYLKRNMEEGSTSGGSVKNKSITSSSSSSSSSSSDGGGGSGSSSAENGGKNGDSDVTAPEWTMDLDSEDTTPVDFECVGAVLKSAGEIVVDNGYGFIDISAHCVEPFEKHAVHFVHSQHARLYILKTDSTLFPGEGFCPWVSVDGNRNELFYRMLRAKVASVLSQRPGSSLKALFAGFPQLTLNQVNVLVSTMAREGLLYARKPTVSSRKSGPFQSSLPSHAPVTGYYLRL